MYICVWQDSWFIKDWLFSWSHSYKMSWRWMWWCDDLMIWRKMHQPALQGLWSSETVCDPGLFNLELIQIVEFVLFNTIQCHSCMLQAAIFMTFVQKSSSMLDLRQVYGPEPGAPEGEGSQWMTGWTRKDCAVFELSHRKSFAFEVLMMLRGSLERGENESW